MDPSSWYKDELREISEVEETTFLMTGMTWPVTLLYGSAQKAYGTNKNIELCNKTVEYHQIAKYTKKLGKIASNI